MPSSQDQRRSLKNLLSEVDLNAYVAMHEGMCDEKQKRWTNCTMEEWVRGGDGAFSCSYCPLVIG